MQRIDAPDATSDNRFTSGDPTIPIPATTVTADWLNSVQEELVNAITAAGITLDKNRSDQLKTAMGILIEAGVGTVTPASIGAAAVAHTTPAATTTVAGHVKLSSAVNSSSVNEAATPAAVKAAYDKAVAAGFILCEFYSFRHPTLKPGFQPAQGGLLANAATLYPDAWAYLQTVEGQKLCKTEAEWQAMTRATWATLADGSTVGWNGIGGAPFYAPNAATGALRLPDLRGMYAEAVGFDALGVGGVHGDGSREITGVTYWADNVGSLAVHTGFSGAFTSASHSIDTPPRVGGTMVEHRFDNLIFDSSRVVPTAPVNRPRAWVALACCYLGAPR